MSSSGEDELQSKERCGFVHKKNYYCNKIRCYRVTIQVIKTS